MLGYHLTATNPARKYYERHNAIREIMLKKCGAEYRVISVDGRTK